MPLQASESLWSKISAGKKRGGTKNGNSKTWAVGEEVGQWCHLPHHHQVEPVAFVPLGTSLTRPATRCSYWSWNLEVSANDAMRHNVITPLAFTSRSCLEKPLENHHKNGQGGQMGPHPIMCSPFWAEQSLCSMISSIHAAQLFETWPQQNKLSKEAILSLHSALLYKILKNPIKTNRLPIKYRCCCKIIFLNLGIVKGSTKYTEELLFTSTEDNIQHFTENIQIFSNHTYTVLVIYIVYFIDS